MPEHTRSGETRLLLENLARQHSDDWRVALRGETDLEATFTHPASAGLVIENVPATADTEELTAFFEERIAATAEFAVASNAPPLEHPELVHGLRAVWLTSNITPSLARGLTAVLVDCGHLTTAEAHWLTSQAD